VKNIIIGLALLAVTACTQTSQDTNTLILGTNASYPPYESVDEKGEIVGFDIDVAQALAQKLGKKLVVKNMSFDALILALKQGKFDIIMGGISITPSREKEITLVPYQGEPIKALTLLFWNKVPHGISSVFDLKSAGNKTVAVQTGTFMDSYLTNVEGVASRSLESTVEMIMDIKHGKAVAALVEPHIATAVMPKHAQLKRLDFPLAKEDWVLGNGIGIRKENAKLSSDVQSAIEQLKAEGVIQKLEAKWFHERET
jgi:arginine transport system substrate-binding protein